MKRLHRSYGLLAMALSFMLVFAAACTTEDEAYEDEAYEGGVETEATQPDTANVSDANTSVPFVYAEWDADANREVDETEFAGRMHDTGVFDDWDLDSNAGINEDEFGRGVYGTWDADRSGVIDENEWNAWSGAWSQERS